MDTSDSAVTSAKSSVLATTPGWVLAMLTAVYAFNMADRYVMSTLIEPLKADLHLSDTAVGMLTGVSLAIFYVLAGLPLSVLADRVNRRNLIAISLSLWSLMTAACGLTRTFEQLFVARALVGIGEAGGTPASQSQISDYYPWHRRAYAFSIYALGIPVGSVLAASAGYLSDAFGWRSAFFALGLPGVLLGIAVYTLTGEPKRGRLDTQPAEAHATFWETLTFIKQQWALVHALAGGTLFTLWSWGLLWWTPSFLMRCHGMSLSDSGGILALIHGIGGTAVILLTTLVMKRLQHRPARYVPLYLVAAALLGTVPSVLAYLTPSRTLSVAMLSLFIPLSYASFGPKFALMQNLVPASMRAQTVAVMLFLSSLSNLVVAPVAVGLMSDHLAPSFGSDALRMALLPLTFVGLWAAFHLWRCSLSIERDLERAGNLAAVP